MGFMMNKEAYRRMIAEDIEALEKSNCSKLEREHITDVLKDSIDRIYGKED